jgi:hypothetical protein
MAACRRKPTSVDMDTRRGEVGAGAMNDGESRFAGGDER